MNEEREIRWRSWMVAAQAGDAPTYEKFLRELAPYLRGFVQRRLLDSDASEDVVQNVLASIHRARHTYRGERPFHPWLHAIARNAIIDYTRIRTRRSVLGRCPDLHNDCHSPPDRARNREHTVPTNMFHTRHKHYRKSRSFDHPFPGKRTFRRTW